MKTKKYRAPKFNPRKFVKLAKDFTAVKSAPAGKTWVGFPYNIDLAAPLKSKIKKYKS